MSEVCLGGVSSVRLPGLCPPGDPACLYCVDGVRVSAARRLFSFHYGASETSEKVVLHCFMGFTAADMVQRGFPPCGSCYSCTEIFYSSSYITLTLTLTLKGSSEIKLLQHFEKDNIGAASCWEVGEVAEAPWLEYRFSLTEWGWLLVRGGCVCPRGAKAGGRFRGECVGQRALY